MVNSSSDIDIIQQIGKGEHQLFELLVERYQNMVFTIAFRITAQREDAEELAQTAFIKAYQNLHTFRQEAKFSTWLYTIVHSVCLSWLRKKRLDTYSLANEKIQSAVEKIQSERNIYGMETKANAKMVHQAMGNLSPEDAQMLTFFYQGEQSLAEIGTILGVEPNTVKVKLFRARQRLKKILEHHFAEELTAWQYQ